MNRARRRALHALPNRTRDRNFGPLPRRTPAAQPPSIDQIAESARAAGFDPAMVYAIQKTGLYMKKSFDELTQEEQNKLSQALHEYRTQHGEEGVEDRVSSAFARLHTELLSVHPKHLCTAALSYAIALADGNGVPPEVLHTMLDAVREEMGERKR